MTCWRPNDDSRIGGNDGNGEVDEKGVVVLVVSRLQKAIDRDN